MYTHSVLSLLPKIITTLGILGVAIGISWSFLDDSDFAFRFVSVGLFLITLLVGILLSTGGALAWTHDYNRRKKLKVAGWIFVTGLIAMVIAPKSVHGHGMPLVLTAVCAWILSIVLAVIAVAGRHRSSNHGISPG